MTGQITYRGPIRGDEGRLAELCAELGYPSSASAVARRLERIVDREDHLVVVAADDSGAPVGWIHAYVARRVESDPVAEIGGLVVFEDRRGAGIGSRLLRKAEDWARSRQARVIRVRSNVVRRRAHRFYARAGYEKTKTSYLFQKSLS